MTPEVAIEYLFDIVNVYIEFMPLSKYSKAEVKKALYKAIDALRKEQE